MATRIKWELRFLTVLVMVLACMSLASCSAMTVAGALGAASMLQGTTSVKVNVGDYKAGVSIKLPKVKAPVLVDDDDGK